ncbi:hypothetical protein A3I50_02980 [Candidatus Roizmanbacteria bacterium RIFCSPLOWO2_02_FULL_37_9]|nr:MAG: hypothetical protein A3F57_03335 [Candidatus Roizmanbacteria bacterium RIFCSPHIGHO2_12_FULL_36_11]OGK55842.1 MAG: hypothetical protein A3I50_02980 [Candidatus Roizmanbacteria bacterium RIFCSPLOWO2_02_FULL_37_9]
MNKALIVIDAQKYFLNKWTEPKVKPILNNIKNYLNINLQKYSLIYFTIFRNDKNSPSWLISGWKDCTRSPDIDLFDELKNFTNKNNVVYKNILSAAKKPQIIEALKENKVQEVHLCGFDTDCCVLATAYDLFDLGLKPVILENLTWSTSKDKLHNAAIKMVNKNIGFVEKV